MARAAVPARGGNHNGLLIGAVAVVAAVVIGIGAAVLFTGDGGDQTAGGATGSSATPTPGANDGGQHKKDKPGAKQQNGKPDLPKTDAVSLHLAGGTVVASDVPGAKAKDGQYVAGINQPGASATWTTNVPKAGEYTVCTCATASPGRTSTCR